MPRRNRPRETPRASRIRLGDVLVRRRNNELMVDGQTRRLKPKVMAVLNELIEARGNVVTKADLLERIWPNMSVTDSVLTEAIHELRRALADSAKASRYIKTIPRRGYRIVADIVEEPVTPTARRTGRQSRPRLAVTSFRSLSELLEDRYFCEGLCEELVNSLGRYNEFDVLGRASTLNSADADIEPSALAERLGANYLVTGTLRRSGASIRVLAHLIEGETGRQLWSDTFDRELVDLIRVQDEIARQIGAAIEPHLDGAPPENQHSRYVPDAEAFREFSKGRYFWKQDNANPERAMVHYQRALEIDPQYAAPYAGMVECYNTLGVFHLAPHVQMREASLAHAEQALFLDPLSAETLFAFGYSQFYMRWNWQAAESAFRKCLSINPNHVLAHSFLSLLCCPLGRRAEALKHAERATELDPFSPFSWMMAGFPFHYFRDFSGCLDVVEQGLAYREDDVVLSWMRADSLVRLDDEADARDAVETLYALTAQVPMFRACAGILYGMLGSPDDAWPAYEQLRSQGGEAACPFVAALGELAIGRLDTAVELLEGAERERDPTVWVVACEPYFDPLRTDERFRAIVRRLGLAGTAG